MTVKRRKTPRKKKAPARKRTGQPSRLGGLIGTWLAGLIRRIVDRKK
jgi:hypothetical protein